MPKNGLKQINEKVLSSNEKVLPLKMDVRPTALLETDIKGALGKERPVTAIAENGNAGIANALPQSADDTTKKTKCPDCDAELDVPKDTENGEILSCPGCGLELEVKQIKGGCMDLQELTIEGEDWGE